MIRSVRGILLLTTMVACLALVGCGSDASITTSSLPGGTINVAYSQQLTGQNVDTWTVSAGALPPGLTLSSGGLISGTPTAAGSFTFTATATSSTNPTAPSASVALTITIASS